MKLGNPAVFWIGSLFIYKAMAFTFSTLLLGFILLDVAHFGFPEVTPVAAIVLIISAFITWYMMAAIVINEVSGKKLLKFGKPLL